MTAKTKLVECCALGRPLAVYLQLSHISDIWINIRQQFYFFPLTIEGTWPSWCLAIFDKQRRLGELLEKTVCSGWRLWHPGEWTCCNNEINYSLRYQMKPTLRCLTIKKNTAAPGASFWQKKMNRFFKLLSPASLKCFVQNGLNC